MTSRRWSCTLLFAITSMIGGQLQHHRLVIHCANAAVVHAINNQTCKQRTVMHMMRPMVSILLTRRVSWEAVQVPGFLMRFVTFFHVDVPGEAVGQGRPEEEDNLDPDSDAPG